MMYTKDGMICNFGQIKQLLPNVMFGEAALPSMGWLPYVPPPPPAPSAEELEKRLIDGIVAATQSRLDSFAKTRNYDGILSACTYATSSIPKFAEEGQYAVNARDTTWATLYSYMAEVKAGTKPVPSGFSDVEPILPALYWPGEEPPTVPDEPGV